MKYLSRALIALACAAVPAAASAGTTIYTDAGAFAAATTGAVTDQFENAATGGYTNYSAGYSGAGLTVLSDSGLLYDFDAAFHPEYYDWGSGDVMTYAISGQLPSTSPAAPPPSRSISCRSSITVRQYGSVFLATLM